MENIITPDGFNPEALLTSRKHRLYVCQTEHEEVIKELTNNGTVGNPDYTLQETATVDKEETDIKSVSCECGESFISQKQGLNHLKQEPHTKEGRIMRKNIRDNLTGVEMYNFKYGGLDAHGSCIFFEHNQLAIRLYATPNYSENGQIDIQLSPLSKAEGDNPLMSIQGQVVDEIECDEVMTTQTYLEHIREWIEENLLNKNYRESVTNE